ncbi:MAG TPA: hypothetical protein VGC98_12085 [Thermoleophilaceae bacterium]|jgi:hypothetical protein
MADESIKQLLAKSSVAFTASVEARGEAGVGGVEPDDRTVVVQVGELLHAPPNIAMPAGSRVTVQLSPDLPELAVGDRATFFANGWVYGDNLAVTEVGRASPEDAAAPTARLAALDIPVSPVRAAVAELEDDKVVEHAEEADAVVRGHVVGLNAVPTAGAPREHDPIWWVATLQVDLVERGELPGGSGTVDVLYANSLDVHWREAPKPKAGESGMWLLHRAPDDLSEHAPFQVLHAIDLQPSLNLELLRGRGREGAG